MVYEVKDTIRVRAIFRDWAPEGEEGILLSPTSVTVNIYDGEQAPIQQNLSALNDSTGSYYYDWTLPDEPGTYYIEFIGDVNGKPQVAREKIKTKWDVA